MIAGLPQNTIYSILPYQNTGEKNEKLYLGTYNGFCRFDPETLIFEKIELPSRLSQTNHFVNSLLADSIRSCIWVGMEGALIRFNPKNGTTEKVSAFDNHSVKSLALDAQGNLLAGTDNGLFVWDMERLNHIIHDSRNTGSLANDIIWSIYTDRGKNSWFGTDCGISMRIHDESVRRYPLASLSGTGEGNHFYSLYKDRKNRFWAGGTNGILRLDFSSSSTGAMRWFRVGNEPFGLPHNRIRHIFEDNKGTVWIATDGSINRYDDESDRFVRYDLTDEGRRYNSNWAYHIYEDANQRLWIATCLGGIFIVDKQSLLRSEGHCVADHNINLENGLNGMFINQLVGDQKGDVWVLLYNNGINRINPNNFAVEKIGRASCRERVLR